MSGDFKERVVELVAQIPFGRVVSYGEIASICGQPRAARIVGGIAHFGDSELPWHRIVKKDGGLAEGYPGGVQGHKEHLEQEGIKITGNYKVDRMPELQWRPDAEDRRWKGGDGKPLPSIFHLPPSELPLVVIVGQTASGKSALAMELAGQFNGELICADSRTVYKEMDIGTAKPSKAEQQTVRHHLLNVIEPNARFTAAEFKALANEALADISSRGKVPIMVGGTGLYVDAVVYDFTFARRVSAAQRDPQNPRHLLKISGDSSRHNLRDNTLMLGMAIEREELKGRIENRVSIMFETGLEDEVRGLAERYGWESEALTGIGYREWKAYFTGHQTLRETKSLIIKNTLGYAKRQKTWFKRNKSIQWITNTSNTKESVADFLSKNSTAKQ